MDPLKKTLYFGAKRTNDFLLSMISILVLFPLLFFLFLVTSIDSRGSPILCQKRIGKEQKIFTILKFRSMKRISPTKGAECLTEEESQRYTTKWGKFLRKTSLDELPQLFNILFGSMSFIGPRPGLTEEGEPELVQYRRSYIPSAYDVKPGLSGYSQVMLKRDHNVKGRARLDSYYVKHMSLKLDFVLFFKTFAVVFRSSKKH